MGTHSSDSDDQGCSYLTVRHLISIARLNFLSDGRLSASLAAGKVLAATVVAADFLPTEPQVVLAQVLLEVSDVAVAVNL